MFKLTSYICEVCGRKYGTEKEAIDCEKSHTITQHIKDQRQLINYKSPTELPKICETCKYFYRNQIDIPACDYITSNIVEYKDDDDLIVESYACCDKYEKKEIL